MAFTDYNTDKVYFAKELSYYKFSHELYEYLMHLDIEYDFIYNAKDIWVRDFMPMQVSKDKFIQFTYNPDYLKNLGNYITNPRSCLSDSDYNITYTDIIADGGNIIRCENCVIMTDKIFNENPHYTPLKLLNKLEQLLETEIIIIPWDKEEKCGHSDGMVRHLGENRLLLNHYYDFDRSLRSQLLKVLSPRFNIEELHFGTDRHIAWSWAYLNYLQVSNYFFMPTFNRRLDDLAQRQLSDLTGHVIFPIHCNSIVKQGGGLNCISWTIEQI